MKSSDYSSKSSSDQGASQAVDLLRTKINALYRKEPDARQEIVEAKAHTRPTSKHQQYMLQLSVSGKSLAEIQTAWHNYYVQLSDTEKHEVWQEFYADQGKAQAELYYQVHHKQDATAVSQGVNQTAATPKHLQSSIRKTVQRNKRNESKQSIWRSLGFGVSMGLIALAFTMFGFFNERVIAPFIRPSSQVSVTPIVGAQANIGPESKIIIPKINVEIPIVFDQPTIAEDDFQASLEDGVVHYPTTSLPGELGNGAIFGHSSNNILNQGKYKFAFVLLNRLEDGDIFMVNYESKQYVYKVYKKHVVTPNQVEILDKQERKATMTLVTCDPPGTSINRLVVVGEQISPSVASNVASSAKPTQAQEQEVLPSNAPSLWSRVTNWF